MGREIVCDACGGQRPPATQCDHVDVIALPARKGDRDAPLWAILSPVFDRADTRRRVEIQAPDGAWVRTWAEAEAHGLSCTLATTGGGGLCVRVQPARPECARLLDDDGGTVADRRAARAQD